MSRYLIESSHTPDECLRNLDEVVAKGPDYLARFDFGCHAGIHTGWAVVEAGNESAARGTLPAFTRDKARIVSVEKETPENIRKYHEMK